MLDEANATRERVLADLVPPAQPAASADRRSCARGPRQPARRVPRREALVPRSDRRARAGRSARRRRTRRARERRPTKASADDFARDQRRRSRPRRSTRSTSGGVSISTRNDAGDRRPRPREPTPAWPTSTRCSRGIRAGQVEAERRAGRGRPSRGRRAGRRRPRRATSPPETPAVEPATEPGARGRERTRADARRRVAGAAGRASLDPLLVTVAKRAKRTAQDDQNALLDAVRRHKGRPDRRAGARARGGSVHGLGGRRAGRDRRGVRRGVASPSAATRCAADDALVNEAAHAIVLPLRERIASAIDTGEEGDTGGLVERIGARFREWKNQSLEEALEDVLVLSWSRGVYDASPDGAVLRWIPLIEGRCADCDDNGLEPTIKGSPFPTGQLHPPAHLGCRCLSRAPRSDTRNIARCGSPRWKSDVVPWLSRLADRSVRSSSWSCC